MIKYDIQRTSQFKKDYKLARKRGIDINKLKEVIQILASGEALPEKYNDHLLHNSRNYKDVRECHISPDWLLIYKIDDSLMVLSLQRTGSHSDLF